MNVDVEYLGSQSWDAEMPARLRWLRENDPVRWSEADRLWLVARYDDVERVSKDQDLFTSGLGVRPGRPKIGLIDEAEPRHTGLRRLINRGFTPRMVKVLERAFTEITTEAIDAVAARGECDFVDAIAVPLPLKLIAAMIGIERGDFERFHRWSDHMIAGDGAATPEILARAGQAFFEYSTYVTRIIEDRRREPRDDLVSILTGAKDQGLLGTFAGKDHPAGTSEEHLTLANDELVMMLVILLVAGNETTRNAISGGMQLLIEHPDERRKLLEDPSLVASAVEEMVRLVSPVHSFSRTATRDTELRGRTIRAGEQVLLLYPSANRDAEVYDAPDAFRVDRNPQHLGFGVGSHFCLGANLARMEMRVAFEHILRRLPDMEYAAGGPVVVPSALVRSCVEMKVRFTPERRAA
ncbi:MAG TPA: cytochrome P450 [Myxococcota bacterium]|nr:cytochrome P450 [Myxococcota bacterium]